MLGLLRGIGRDGTWLTSPPSCAASSRATMHRATALVIIDGPPSATNGEPNLGGLFDIWHDKASGPLDPQGPHRSGAGALRALPCRRQREGALVRDQSALRRACPPRRSTPPRASASRSFDAEDHLTDQSKHPAMHKTGVDRRDLPAAGRGRPDPRQVGHADQAGADCHPARNEPWLAGAWRACAFCWRS